MTTAFPFDPWKSPLETWMKPGRDAAALDLWAKPGRDAFEFWISFFPTAPLFGVEWRFAGMMEPALNPFGVPTAGATFAPAPHPGDLASAAKVDERVARPVAHAADIVGEAAKDMTRIAGEASKAAARTTDTAMRTGTELAATAVENQDKAVDLAEETGSAALHATEAAATMVEDAGKTAEIAADEAGEAASEAARRDAKATEETAETAAGSASETAEIVDHAIAAAPKPKMLLDKRPDEVDDLKAIRGIGPDLERQLNGLGLYRFDQLAKMKDADLAWLDANITRFKGRCFRDDWVGQAKARAGK